MEDWSVQELSPQWSNRLDCQNFSACPTMDQSLQSSEVSSQRESFYQHLKQISLDWCGFMKENKTLKK